MLMYSHFFRVCFISTVVSGVYEKLRHQYPKVVDGDCFIEKPMTMTRRVEIVRSQLNTPQHKHDNRNDYRTNLM